MTNLQLKKLKSDYENACNAYVKAFEEKQGREFDYWIGQEVGGIASFIDQYFFNMSDIVHDIDNNCPVDLIFEWQDDCVEAEAERHINYYSYSTGLRFSDL